MATTTPLLLTGEPKLEDLRQVVQDLYDELCAALADADKSGDMEDHEYNVGRQDGIIHALGLLGMTINHQKVFTDDPALTWVPSNEKWAP